MKDNHKQNKEMDDRCLRKLDEFPQSFCPLAVLRLKALRNAGRELTEEEESKLPGCPYAISHQMSNYCFFKFIKKHYPNKNISDMEIAHYNSVSVETVKKVERQAIASLKDSKNIKEIADIYSTDRVVDELNDGTEWEFADH